MLYFNIRTTVIAVKKISDRDIKIRPKSNRIKAIPNLARAVDSQESKLTVDFSFIKFYYLRNKRDI